MAQLQRLTPSLRFLRNPDCLNEPDDALKELKADNEHLVAHNMRTQSGPDT